MYLELTTYSVLRCFDTVFLDCTLLLQWAPRQSSHCQTDVKFVPVIGLGLNFSVVYIL